MENKSMFVVMMDTQEVQKPICCYYDKRGADERISILNEFCKRADLTGVSFYIEVICTY